jgi:hypothetical protein
MLLQRTKFSTKKCKGKRGIIKYYFVLISCLVIGAAAVSLFLLHILVEIDINTEWGHAWATQVGHSA